MISLSLKTAQRAKSTKKNMGKERVEKYLCCQLHNVFGIFFAKDYS